MTKAIDQAEAKLAQLLAVKARWEPDLWSPAISPVAVENARRLLRERPALAEGAEIYPDHEVGVRIALMVGDMETDIDFDADGKIDLCGFHKDGSGSYNVVAGSLDADFMRLLDERISPPSDTDAG